MLYKIVDPTSEGCISNGLNLFQPRPTNVTVNNSIVEEILTLNSIDTHPFHFKISPSDGFLDLSKIYLSTTFKIAKKKKDESKWEIIDSTDLVSPIQALGSTYIKNVKVLVNGKEAFNSNQLYSYKSFIDLELSQTSATKNSYGQSYGYFEDDLDVSAVTGKGFLARRSMFEKGSVEFVTKLFIDLFNQENYFLNNTEIDIEIQPNTQEFCLIEKPKEGYTYTLFIENCRLFVKKVYLMDTLSRQIASRLNTTPAKYSLTKTELKTTFINSGRYEYVTNLFQEQVPKRLIIGLVPHKAYVGDRAASPFTFKHFDVQSISVQVNGRQYPNVLYNLDFDTYKYTRLFHDFYENLGFADTTESMNITMDKFKTNSCFFVFNLANNQEIDSCFDLIKEGTTSVHIRFKSAVPTNGITLVAYAELDGLALLDKNRVLSSDITV